MLYLERYRARDKAFSGSGVVQAARDVLVRAGRELRVRPQRDALEFPSAALLLDLYAGGVITLSHDDDASVSAKVQVPELMTGGERGDEQLASPALGLSQKVTLSGFRSRANGSFGSTASVSLLVRDARYPAHHGLISEIVQGAESQNTTSRTFGVTNRHPRTLVAWAC